MITIITDSGSDIPQEEAKRLGIKVIPIITLFGNTEYRDGIDISYDEFYSRLENNHEFAKTTQVNPITYQEVFEEELDKGNEIICITIGSKLSGCFQSANIAKNSLNTDKISIVDSNSVCVGQRNLVYLAIGCLNKGMNRIEVVNFLESKKNDLVVLATVDTLEYLQKGGRISKTIAIIGGLLSIKPVIELQSGVIKLIGKARGYKNAHNMVSKVVEKYNGIDFSLPYSTAYSGNNRALLDKYLESNKELYKENTTSVPVYRIGAAIGTHCGPGTITLSFFKKKQH